jgi:acetyltransferase-like isoleucine patch superfamily enzyme
MKRETKDRMIDSKESSAELSSSEMRLEDELGLRRSPLARVLSRVAGIPRTNRALLGAVSRLEGGSYYSFTLRKLLLDRYGVYAGAYSYGQWTKPAAMPFGTVIGRYVSMANNVAIFTANHPYDRLSTAPFFFNASLGYLDSNSIANTACWVGHDAWIGYSAIITPSCSRIGIGAVVGAGAVVTKDVPDFAVVAGNPAKLLKYRFDEATRERVLESRWWERTLDNLLPFMNELVLPVEGIPSNHALLMPRDS